MIVDYSVDIDFGVAVVVAAAGSPADVHPVHQISTKLNPLGTET